MKYVSLLCICTGHIIKYFIAYLYFEQHPQIGSSKPEPFYSFIEKNTIY